MERSNDMVNKCILGLQQQFNGSSACLPLFWQHLEPKEDLPLMFVSLTRLLGTPYGRSGDLNYQSASADQLFVVR